MPPLAPPISTATKRISSISVDVTSVGRLFLGQRLISLSRPRGLETGSEGRRVVRPEVGRRHPLVSAGVGLPLRLGGSSRDVVARGPGEGSPVALPSGLRLVEEHVLPRAIRDLGVTLRLVPGIVVLGHLRVIAVPRVELVVLRVVRLTWRRERRGVR